MRNPDVLLVGGGAIGAASALELARRGARVMLIERGPQLAAGCSAGNAGLICPSHAFPLATPGALRQGLRWMLKRDSPFYLRPRPAVVPWLGRFAAACTPRRAEASMRVIRALSLESLALHAALADDGLDTSFTRQGILNVYETVAGFAAGRREASLHAAAGLRSESLSAERVRSCASVVGGAVAGGVLYPEEAHCDPERFVRAVGEAAVEASAEVRLQVEAIRLRRANGRLVEVETTAGPVRPGALVLAAGAWTGRLVRDLGIFIPLEGGKGYHVELEPSDGDPELPVFLQEARVIATPLPGRLRLSGMLELAGLDLQIDHVRLRAIVQAATRVLSLGDRRVIHVWRGLRPCPPDGLPIVGRPEGLENVVLATGHAMMGLTLAPVTGRIVAELVAGESTTTEVSALRPGRFRRLQLTATPSEDAT